MARPEQKTAPIPSRADRLERVIRTRRGFADAVPQGRQPSRVLAGWRQSVFKHGFADRLEAVLEDGDTRVRIRTRRQSAKRAA